MEMALLGTSVFSFLIGWAADVARLKLAKLRGLVRLVATGLLCLVRIIFIF